MRRTARIVVLAVLLAACGGQQAATTTTAAPVDTTQATSPPTTGADAATTTEAMSTEPIRIGALTSLTGPFTPWGVHVRDGMLLAAEEINAEGGVDGRTIEIVVSDDQSNPEEGVTALERLIEQDGVVAVGGIISSGVGAQTAQLAEQLSMPLFLVKSGSQAILTQDSRFTFRTCLPAAPMVAGPIAQYAQSEGLTRLGGIIADYAWGQAIRAAMENAFTAAGLEFQIEVAPVEETDFTTYLRALEAFDPEMIVATGHPPGSGPITVQSADLGFAVPVTGAYTPRSLVVGGVAEAAIDRYADFGCADVTSEDYQDLARRYLAFSDNTFLEDDAIAGFGIVTMVADAVGAVGDDPTAIAEYLHGQTYDLPGYSFTMAWTEWGELAEAQIAFDVIGPGPAPEGVNEAGEWYPERLILSEPLEVFEP